VHRHRRADADRVSFYYNLWDKNLRRTPNVTGAGRVADIRYNVVRSPEQGGIQVRDGATEIARIVLDVRVTAPQLDGDGRLPTVEPVADDVRRGGRPRASHPQRHERRHPHRAAEGSSDDERRRSGRLRNLHQWCPRPTYTAAPVSE
jgi:hypothetical protein